MSRPATTLGFLIALALLPRLAPHEVAASRPRQQAREARPNIIYILADDLGYGDLSRLNDHSKIRTPNMDRLAAEGMIFTDAHSSSSVCTPSRYGILTGRYAWRSRLKEGVLWGYSPPLIETGRLTVASFLKNHGYATGGVGKWHLGLGWQTTDKKPLTDRQNERGRAVDFTKPINRGPTELGFDYFFGIPASLDMEPYVYIENDRVVERPTATIEMHEQGSEGFWRGGRSAPDFRHINVLPTLTQRAVDFIEREGRQSSDRPFFLYFALSAPHTPVVPNQPFVGRSRAGRYGDFVVQVDSVVGQIMQTVEDLGIAHDTMIIMTSDNGPERFMEARKGKYGHDSAHHFRGMKRDIWEGGHRVPFIVRWPAKVQPGRTNDHTISLTDLLATVADVLRAPLPEGAGEDSDSFLPALLGTSLKKPLREATVHHSSQGEFAIREGPWKLCLTSGSGGNVYRSGRNATKADAPPGQLYNLANDPGETKNLYGQHPEIVERLTKRLDQYKAAGRSHRRLPKAR